MAASSRPRLLAGKRVLIFVDFSFEDMELMYPKIRLEEEGAIVVVAGVHPSGMNYKGKHGYPLKSDASVDEIDHAAFDALVLPGGFAPDYMRRSSKMLQITVAMADAGKPVASICHGPWMLCSARRADGAPLAKGRRVTSFVAIKDDLSAPLPRRLVRRSLSSSDTPSSLSLSRVLAHSQRGCDIRRRGCGHRWANHHLAHARGPHALCPCDHRSDRPRRGGELMSR